MSHDIRRFGLGLAGVSGSFVIFQAILLKLTLAEFDAATIAYEVGFLGVLYLLYCLLVWGVSLIAVTAFVGPLNRARARESFFWSVLAVTVLLMALNLPIIFAHIEQVPWQAALFCGIAMYGGVTAFLEKNPPPPPPSQAQDA